MEDYKKLDLILQELLQVKDKIDAISQGILDKQIPILNTIAESLRRLNEAVEREPSGEIEQALTDMANAIKGQGETLGKVHVLVEKISAKDAELR